MDPEKAKIDPSGQALFPAAGEITLAAIVPPEYVGGREERIPVKVRVLPKKEGEGGMFGSSSEEAIKEKKEYSEKTVQVDIDGKKVKLAVEPGDLTVVAGKGATFRVRALDGELPENAHFAWTVLEDPNGCSIDENGKAIFRHPGEIVVNAMIPGVAKDEPFLFMNSIGKVAKGMDLLKPQNFDVLGLILLFGVTMYLSQKLMVTTPPSDPEQAAVQKQTQQIMPFTITGMFFFMPLPSGVYLYMVVSNIIQTLQTWLLMKSPAPELPDFDDDNSGAGKTPVIEVLPGGKTGKKSKDVRSGANAAGSAVIDVTPNDKKGKKAGDSAENPVKLKLTESDKEGKNN